MGISPAKVPNVHIDTVFNGSQNNYSNNLPSKPSKIKNSTENLRIFHQNIRGLHRKVDELSTHWLKFPPNILCFTEHHLKDYEIGNRSINRYNLGAFYCRKGRKHGEVCIFVHDTLTSTNTDLSRYCKELDLEACAIKMRVSDTNFCILCIYNLLQVTFQSSCIC